LISIDIINAYNEINRAAVVDAHMRHTHFVRWVPFWTSKLGPTSKLWAGKDYMEHHEGLVQGSPISSSGFSFTIHNKVKEADMRMVELGGCARFGMDDGYMIGPPEVVFQVLAEFAVGIKENCGCELNFKKCKMYNKDEGACEAARRAGHIPETMQHLNDLKGHILDLSPQRTYPGGGAHQ
jgi:hypothetical protein